MCDNIRLWLKDHFELFSQKNCKKYVENIINLLAAMLVRYFSHVDFEHIFWIIGYVYQFYCH